MGSASLPILRANTHLKLIVQDTEAYIAVAPKVRHLRLRCHRNLMINPHTNAASTGKRTTPRPSRAASSHSGHTTSSRRSRRCPSRPLRSSCG